jgi:hypothetical protein
MTETRKQGDALSRDDDPYCGAELLPHATFPDGSPAPILCTLPVHGPEILHCNDELGTSWSWGW